MKTIGLDGKEFKIKLVKKNINDNFKSRGHLECRKILKALYPADNIFEEITICPGLIVDFILPLRRFIVEVQGGQHYNYNSFFHSNLGEFNNQKNRDNSKIEWSRINKFTLLQLNDKEIDSWKQQILGAFNA